MAHLLRQRRFAPFFWTQFLGAFNDNVYKNALLILLAFQASDEAESGLMVNLASGLFILPFLVLSPLAGQVSDKYDKGRLMRWIKLSEIGIMLLGSVAFFAGHTASLVAVLFLMGTHSTFFGPIKYSILPQHLDESELMSGNSLVEMGTFVAILLGTITGGILYSWGHSYLSLGLLSFALLGWLSSRHIPAAPAADPQLRINLNPVTEIRKLYHLSRQTKAVYLSLIGISWFWFLGAIMLSQIPTFVKHTLAADEYVVTFFLAIFTLSIALGSLVCDKVSDAVIELGIVPLGAFGMSVFALDLGLLDTKLVSGLGFTIADFFGSRASLSSSRIVLDLAGLGFFGSFFIVPLYALMQHRSPPAECSRVIAANNIANSIFMVASAGFAMLLYSLGVETQGIFMVVALLNLGVALYIFLLVPEFMARFLIWLLAKTIYTLRYRGRRHIPRSGPLLIVANHVSFIDWFIVTAACQRPVRFIMDHRIYRLPLLHLFFRLGGCIPIAPAKEDAQRKAEAFKAISQALRDGEVVCIFPEGGITFDGQLAPFKRGVEQILQQDPVPVVPMALRGLWGSFFSRKSGRAMASLPKPRRRLIEVIIGPPLSAATASAERLASEVTALLAKEETPKK